MFSGEENKILSGCRKTVVTLGGQSIQMYIPDQEKIKVDYDDKKRTGIHIEFPFWAKLWPAAKAICLHIKKYPGLVKGKSVLELGAGLGLPSLFAASYASDILCTDLVREAVIISGCSARENNFRNFSTSVFDWKERPVPDADLIIASDISYDQTQFGHLLNLVKEIEKQQRKLLLATPQRLQTGLFIQELETMITKRKDYLIEENDANTVITVIEIGN